MANLSMILACWGRCSLMRIPGTLVSIGLNSPRTSEGASGFRSYPEQLWQRQAADRQRTDLEEPSAGDPIATAVATANELEHVRLPSLFCSGSRQTSRRQRKLSTSATKPSHQ